MGLIFMAMAGYNPNEAVSFWERMAAASKGQKPPELAQHAPGRFNKNQQSQKAYPRGDAVLQTLTNFSSR